MVERNDVVDSSQLSVIVANMSIITGCAVAAALL